MRRCHGVVKGAHVETSQLVEIESSELFGEENVNWRYCLDNAAFSHREACEFIVHLGDTDFQQMVIDEMTEYGCTADFVQAYKDAAATGALRVLFYV